MADVIWHVTIEQALDQTVEQQARRIRQAIRALALYFAPQIETWMKQNAPWTDRTGNARQGLYAALEDVNLNDIQESIVLYFDHSMIYGFYLETKNSGAYAVVAPALDFWAPRIYAALKRMLA